MTDLRYLTYLSICAVVTIFFSMFNASGIRGYRNLGFLAIYLGTIVWLCISPFTAIMVGWCAFGLTSGILYYLYELVSVARSSDRPREWPKPITVLHGLVAWPVMLPEMIEYSLTDVGILKSAVEPVDNKQCSIGDQEEVK